MSAGQPKRELAKAEDQSESVTRIYTDVGIQDGGKVRSERRGFRVEKYDN